MSSAQEKEIIYGSEFAPSRDCMFTQVKVNASGGKNSGILNSNTKKATYLSTPLMMTWGINEYVDEKSGKKSYEMSLQFPRESDSNYSDDTVSFLNSLQEFEAKIKKDAATIKSKEWFNKDKMSPEVIDALWTPMLRYPKDDSGEPDTSRPPTLRIKIPYWENKFNLEMYDMNQNLLFPNVEDDQVSPLTLIHKNQNVALVILNGGIWFANGKFGTTWKLFQAVVQPKTSLRGKCHIRLSSESKQILEKEAQAEVDQEEEEQALVEDSDEEQEQEEEPEPVPEPEPVKKKVVRRAKK